MHRVLNSVTKDPSTEIWRIGISDSTVGTMDWNGMNSSKGCGAFQGFIRTVIINPFKSIAVVLAIFQNTHDLSRHYSGVQAAWHFHDIS
jgi:hypothetical protein